MAWWWNKWRTNIHLSLDISFCELHFTVEDMNKKLEGAIRKASSPVSPSPVLFFYGFQGNWPLNKKSVFEWIILLMRKYFFYTWFLSIHPHSLSNDTYCWASLLTPTSPSQSFLTGKGCLAKYHEALLSRFESRRGISVEKSKVGCLYSLRNPLAIPFG